MAGAAYHQGSEKYALACYMRHMNLRNLLITKYHQNDPWKR